MCDELEFFEFIEQDAAQHNTRNKMKRANLRTQCDPFDMDDNDFIRRYRLNKDLVQTLCEDLRSHVPASSKSSDLSLEIKVLVALSFYATGSYQRPTGDIVSHSMSQSTVSSVIRQITKLLNLPQIQTKYIKFPRTPQERRANVAKFYRKFGMPGVLGCIDCTHVAIIRPSQNEERYYCRKQYHSLNVQLISNAEMEIISVDASYGGATHDSYIWNNHPIKEHLEEISNNESLWLLGDSGYPLRKYLMTPISNTTSGTRESYYTEVHVKTRNTIERTIGLLKARFRCLLVHRVLHYTPEVAASIVNACVVLHNMCIQSQLPAELLPDDVTQDTTTEPVTDDTHHSDGRNRELSEGLRVRQALISRLWESRISGNE